MADRVFSLPSLQRLGRTRFRVVLGFILIGLGTYVLIQKRLNNYAYFVVDSESMEPTLKIGDRLVMLRPDHYERGEIVVFNDPMNSATLLVKRIVAMAPDIVAVRGGHIYVNGRYQPAPREADSGAGIPERAWRLNNEEIFVAGDNRPNSKDSRDYGPIPPESLRGAVRYRVDGKVTWTPIK